MRNNRLINYKNMKRDAWVEINLDSIEHNVLEIKKILPAKTKLLSVIKADAYGCGSIEIAPTLLASGVDIFGVASIDEGMQLRQAQFDTPILILGAAPIWSFDYAALHDIMLSIFSDQHIQACKIAFEKTGIKPKVHIKIDTGMNRIGVNYLNAVDFIKKVQSCDFIDLKGIFSHLAISENEYETLKQLNKWNNVINSINSDNLSLHILNTAGILSFQQDVQKYNMVRLGIETYGFLPDLPLNRQVDIDIKNVISLKARIVNIHNVHKGEGISYSHTYIEKKDNSLIATIPIGYADGVSRGLSNKISGLLNGKIVKQVGNITMDQMMFDISNVADAKEGDIITLLGDDGNHKIYIDSWAKILNTIHYELICRLKVRLSRVYTR